MNTKQIIAELRRSACEDANPFEAVHYHAYYEAQRFAIDIATDYQPLRNLQDSHIRTFYLLVAEAMKSERKEKQNEQATKSA